MIGFVLALMSLLTIGITVFLFMQVGEWLYQNGIYSMDLFFVVFFVTLFLAVQGILLFGFPLYYAQDKKSHMTGLRILVWALLWMLGLVFVSSLILVPLTGQESFSLEQLESELGTEVTEVLE